MCWRWQCGNVSPVSWVCVIVPCHPILYWYPDADSLLLAKCWIFFVLFLQAHYLCQLERHCSHAASSVMRGPVLLGNLGLFVDQCCWCSFPAPPKPWPWIVRWWVWERMGWRVSWHESLSLTSMGTASTINLSSHEKRSQITAHMSVVFDLITLRMVSLFCEKFCFKGGEGFSIHMNSHSLPNRHSKSQEVLTTLSATQVILYVIHMVMLTCIHTCIDNVNWHPHLYW